MVSLTFLVRALVPFEVGTIFKGADNLWLFAHAVCTCCGEGQHKCPLASFGPSKFKIRSNKVSRKLSENPTACLDGSLREPHSTIPATHSTMIPSPAPRVRRIRSLLHMKEAQNFQGIGKPDELFCSEKSHKVDDEVSISATLKMKAELYDQEVDLLRKQVEGLQERLVEARGIVDNAEQYLEDILSRNIKLERELRTLKCERVEIQTAAEQYRDDLSCLHDWIYTIQTSLLSLGIHPAFLNDKLNVKLKIPRPFPSLSPNVATTLVKAEGIVTPPMTPPPSSKSFRGDLRLLPRDFMLDAGASRLHSSAESSATRPSSPLAL